MDTDISPDGAYKALIRFCCGGKVLHYDTGRSPDEVSEGLHSDQLPMLVDLDMIAATDSLLHGMQVWTRSAVWYNRSGKRLEGRKFVPVTISSVAVGTEAFPARVDFTDERGNAASTYLNFGASAADSRSFSDLFYLSDPRNNYSRISDTVWALIQNSRLTPGMTKEECRLSVGNPEEVASGHDYSQTLDVWRYQNGAVLRFADGLLVDYRL